MMHHNKSDDDVILNKDNGVSVVDYGKVEDTCPKYELNVTTKY